MDNRLRSACMIAACVATAVGDPRDSRAVGPDPAQKNQAAKVAPEPSDPRACFRTSASVSAPAMPEPRSQLGPPAGHPPKKLPKAAPEATGPFPPVAPSIIRQQVAYLAALESLEQTWSGSDELTRVRAQEETKRKHLSETP